MPKKIRPNKVKNRYKIKVRYFGLALTLMCAACGGITMRTRADGCPDVKVIFARGSGAEKDTSADFVDFKTKIDEKVRSLGLNIVYEDLDYPAVAIDDLSVIAGAYFGGGNSYEFGESVDAGVRKLIAEVNNGRCNNTKYVVGGYSQGAMVVSRALSSLKAERVIYAATFGDPKIYLPEGEGIIPAACKGENLSSYRVYVPDCRAYEGLLGSVRPYQPEVFAGKLGTWCNKRDIFCSSHFSITSHVSYVSDNLYEDASRVIVSKIAGEFQVKNNYSSPHDTAILIDSTGSMSGLIDSFKAEALRLAQETFAVGGRVALYDYRDLDDPYEPVEHCDFTTCDAETFERELAAITVDGGGDGPESLLSASFKVMEKLDWRLGATKSLVVLSDANFLSPDRDGITLADVVALSKRIDPVNFYIVTVPGVSGDYAELARATDGRVVSDAGDFSLITDGILERFDTLPRVEEELAAGEPPTLVVDEVLDHGEEVEVHFKNYGKRVIVILNDALLGLAEDAVLTVGGLDRSVQNTLRLVPITDDVRGIGETIEISPLGMFVPKTPNTAVAW